MGPETDGICVLIRVKKRSPYLLLRRDNREPFFSFLPPSLSPPPSLSLPGHLQARKRALMRNNPWEPCYQIFQSLELEEDKFLFKSHSLWYFVMQPELTVTISLFKRTTLKTILFFNIMLIECKLKYRPQHHKG